MTKAFIHERAWVESEAVGEGTRIWAFTHVFPEARIGNKCNIGEHCFIENHVSIGNGCTIKNGVALWDRITLEDDVFVGPYAVFTNDLRPRAFLKASSSLFLPTLVKKGATIGANATIVCGITIGEFAMVGAGSVVIEDVPAHTLVVGNPAKSIARIGYCGLRLDPRGKCSLCEKLVEECCQNDAIELFKNQNIPRDHDR